MDSLPSPAELRTEHLINPLGIDAWPPRLSWLTSLPGRGDRQTAYRIGASRSLVSLEREEYDLWDSGRVEGADSVLVPYAGAELAGRERAWWRVMIWDKAGRSGVWSAPAWFEMGVLALQDWSAEWIGHAVETTAQDGLVLPPVRYMRRLFPLDKPVVRARIYATARGVYKLRLNGKPVSDTEFAPGWTDYRKRIQYQTYDVTDLLQSGENAFCALLGEGWYAGYIGFRGGRAHYGENPELLAQLIVDHPDGTVSTVSTDPSWLGSTGPIQYSDMLMGERYDARLEMDGWDTVGYDDSGWNHVTPGEPGRSTGVPLVAQPDNPVRVTERMEPLAVRPDEDGNWLVDMGQNIVGRIRLSVTGKPGSVITLRYGEMLDDDGGIYTVNLRSARSTDQYVIRGSIGYALGARPEGAPEIWEPTFTFHGFRYVEVDGYPGQLTADCIVAHVIESDTESTGSLQTGSAMVNQLVKNIEWGQRGNYLSVPTDCPQRDERLGWLGDAQVFVRTAAYNRNVAAFFTKWLRDVVDAQSGDGGFPDVAPRVVDDSDGAPAWGDAGVICPWTIYQAYGDIRILQEMYQPMKRWIRYIADANPNGLWLHRRNNDFGDWLSIEADTPKDLIATAYYAYDCLLMAQMAEALAAASASQTPAAGVAESADADPYGKEREALASGGDPAAVQSFASPDAIAFYSLYQHVRQAFIDAFVWADGSVKGETQTGYLLALKFGLLPDNLREAAAVRLVADLEAHDYHLTTGFVGVSYLCPVLTQIGRTDAAYRLLLNDTFPSWGYSIKHGATTIWERWDGWTAEGGFHDPGMNSFNHYALGSIGEWLYGTVAGIGAAPGAPGFRCLQMRPSPNRTLGYARARYRTPYGQVESYWRYDGNDLLWSVTIPSGSMAILTLPTDDGDAVSEGGKPIDDDEIYVTSAADDSVALVIESGAYEFRWPAGRR